MTLKKPFTSCSITVCHTSRGISDSSSCCAKVPAPTTMVCSRWCAAAASATTASTRWASPMVSWCTLAVPPMPRSSAASFSATSRFLL